MIALRLISHRPERRQWLEAVLNTDPELQVVYSGADFDDIAHHTGLGADVIIVDLSHPRVLESRFWSALHVLFTGARLMALAEAPIDPIRLEAALHAGAYYMLEWSEPVERLKRTARAAGACDGFIPLGNVIRGISDYFRAAGLPMRRIRIGHVNVNPQRCTIEQGAKEIPLTSLELDLLLYLAANAGRPVPTSELLQTVWHESPRSPHLDGQIKSTVKRLRQKLEPEPSRPQYLLNRHGHGNYVPNSAVE